MIIGLGHPRCGTGFTASLLQEHGRDVGHEAVGADGIVSWMQVAKRSSPPWGTSLVDYPPDTSVFLVARSPLAALNSVATENQQIRSIGFRAEVIWERCGIDMFAAENQTGEAAIYDYLGWAVMSMAYWYRMCLEEKPEFVYRVEQPRDDGPLGDLAGVEVVRKGKKVWRNAYGAHKVSERLDYSMEELGRIGKPHLAALAEVTDVLGYPDEARVFAGYL
jgi:hypothetical protein